MKIIRDIEKSALEIQKCIKKYGHLAQHNFYLYLNYGREGEKNVFFGLKNNRGVFAYQKFDQWRILTDPLCPQEEKLKTLVQTIDYVFRAGAKKIILEDMSDGIRKGLVIESKKKSWRVLQLSYSLIWPIVDLENWTGGGGDWKRLRNLYNKFFKDNRVEIKKPSRANAYDIKKMILGWKKQRNETDRVHLEQYLRFVDSDFAGCEMVRIFVCQGQPISITAGWSIPNSDKVYYSCISIYDYNYKNIGEASYWDELIELKKLGYKKVDYGGSEGGLLNFKMKFHPTSTYKTDVFSILKKHV